ncbi:MAG: hypothetical protein IJB47_05065 [Oscillospiraceae bacterium]|nr:hypothetical protein [Oscillospiraceae bacterium]
MKIVGTILKILAALAAIAGAIYVIATYGDRIVAWAKDLMSKYCYCDCCGDCCCDGEDCCCDDCCEDAPAEDADFVEE